MTVSDFRQGNLLISKGRLHVGRESLPLSNIESLVEQLVRRPKRHWTAIMVGAVILFLTGLRFSAERWAWGFMGAGLLLAGWNWSFNRQPVWVVRLNLLLNQRIKIVFEDAADSEAFVAALAQAKSGKLPVMRASR
jgi:hypothetical protein